MQREFATNAAHELRTPLASIVTAVEMLQTGAKDEPATRDEFLEVIARESARLTRLTRALLVLARAGARDELPQPRRRVRSRRCSSRSPRRCRSGEGVEVGVDCPRALAIVGDADLLEQALSSVATNAVQHTDARPRHDARPPRERLGRDRGRRHRQRHPGARPRPHLRPLLPRGRPRRRLRPRPLDRPRGRPHARRRDRARVRAVRRHDRPHHATPLRRRPSRHRRSTAPSSHAGPATKETA